MSTFSDVLNILPNSIIEIFRSIEKVKKKIVNKNWSLIFNQTCLNEIYKSRIYQELKDLSKHWKSWSGL